MKRIPKPLNIRQQRFAELVAGGMPAVQAYKAAGYAANGRNAEGNAHALMENHGVKAKIAELRALESERTGFTRERLIDWLVAIITTPIGNVSSSSPLVQESLTELKGAVTRSKVKMAGKIDAARMLCDVMGWRTPEKLEVSTSAVTLARIEEIAAKIKIVSPLLMRKNAGKRVQL